MEITIKDKNINRLVQRQVMNQLGRAIGGRRMRSVMQRQAALLSRSYVEGEDFQALKGSLVGEFGFTPEEVGQLDGVFGVLSDDPSITNIEVIVSPKLASIILNWCDYDEFAKHPVALHDLTRNVGGAGFQTIQTVSWVEWLEKGVTVRGYEFDPTGRGKYSRSGFGLMREGHGMWAFAPTFALEKAAGSVDFESHLRKGLGAVLGTS